MSNYQPLFKATLPAISFERFFFFSNFVIELEIFPSFMAHTIFVHICRACTIWQPYHGEGTNFDLALMELKL